MHTETLTNSFRPVARWFAGQSFWALAMAFILLSAADLLATLQTVPTGIMKEGNLAANTILMNYGVGGMIAQKVLLVVLAIATLKYVAERHPRQAFAVLWGSVLLMAFVALYHLTLFAGLAMG